jgi:hypothetical protein
MRPRLQVHAIADVQRVEMLIAQVGVSPDLAAFQKHLTP